MNKIQATKVNTTINLYVNGKMYKKTFETNQQSNDVYRLILETKNDATDLNVKRMLLKFKNVNIRQDVNGLDYSLDDDCVYLRGFTTPIPQALVKVVEDYHDNKFPLDPIINFWSLLMINEDKRIRETLFRFITEHNLVITDNGYFIAYKSVDFSDKSKSELTKDLVAMISNYYLKVKKDWKTSPKKYTLYQTLEGEYRISKSEMISSDNKNKIIGNLDQLYRNISNLNTEESIQYTDHHTHTMTIKLGEPVIMERKECDGDPQINCSYGLHVGTSTYAENFCSNSNKSPILACLVNPANVIAIPNSDATKMRVCEYFPFAIASRNNDGRIDIIDQPYFELDYIKYEKEWLNEMIDKIKEKEQPIQSALNSESQPIDLNEMLKIIENRKIKIN